MIFTDDITDEKPHYDTILGTDKSSDQYGLIGERSGRKIALDLNHPLTISLFGIQGAGKSYSLGAISEMAVTSIPGINQLSHPLAAVVFHYSATQNYPPEFCSMTHPNTDAQQIEQLKTIYGAEPKSLDDVVMLTHEDQVETRKKEYPSIDVKPIKFASKELHLQHWKFLMGAIDNKAAYIQDIMQLIRHQRRNGILRGESLFFRIFDSEMPEPGYSLALRRLNYALQYIDDEQNLSSIIQPGKLIIVDMRDELIAKDDALGLFIVIMSILSEAEHEGQSFNKMMIFDECHKYIDSPSMTRELSEVVREMRHRGSSVVIASQDPPSVPKELIELSSIIFLHKFNSPNWLKHVKDANTAFKDITPKMMSDLQPGEAYIWANKSSEINFTRQPYKFRCRPRVTKHGGDSVLASRTSTTNKQEVNDKQDLLPYRA